MAAAATLEFVGWQLAIVGRRAPLHALGVGVAGEVDHLQCSLEGFLAGRREEDHPNVDRQPQPRCRTAMVPLVGHVLLELAAVDSKFALALAKAPTVSTFTQQRSAKPGRPAMRGWSPRQA